MISQLFLISGAKTREELQEALDNIYPILKSFKKQWKKIMYIYRCIYLFSTVECATWVAHLILDLITVMFGQKYRSYIAALQPQSLHHFAWRPSAQNSQQLRFLLPQSRDSSCYVSRPILTIPPLLLHKHTDQRAHDFAHSPTFWHLPMIAKFLVHEAGDFVHLILLYQCADIRKTLCLSFRMHRAAPNCVLRRSQALVTCKFCFLYFIPSLLCVCLS